MAIPSDTSDSNSESQENVTGKLRQRIALLDDPQKSFLPKEAMETVLTENTIRLLLQQMPEAKDISLDDITGNKKRIKLLSILLLAERVDLLKHLIDHEVSDVDLPLELDRPRLAPCLGRERAIVDYFLTSQFKVCVPVFDFFTDGVMVKQLHKNQRLPFLTKSELGNGGQGRVWRVEIPPGHLTTLARIPSVIRAEPKNLAKLSRAKCSYKNTWGKFRKGPSFALKEFSNRDYFDRELDALNHFKSHNKHKHLINLLSAYSQGNKYFMIFPWAIGNLDTLWKSVNPRQMDPLWLLEQCYGLTEGLCKIHQYHEDKPGKPSTDGKLCVGRHGDIKPQNILWFKDSSTAAGVGRLVLSDFTLMRFHNEGSNTVTTVGHIGFTNTYRAPEVAFTSHQYISQKYDVWSIGCVFLEFISWHLVGYNATRGEQFRGDNGQRYRSFMTTRFMEDSRDFNYHFRDDNYFRFGKSMGETHVKISVRQVSLTSRSLNFDFKELTYECFFSGYHTCMAWNAALTRFTTSWNSYRVTCSYLSRRLGGLLIKSSKDWEKYFVQGEE